MARKKQPLIIERHSELNFSNTNDGLGSFLKEIGRYPLLKPHEQLSYSRKVRTAISIIKKFPSANLSIDNPSVSLSQSSITSIPLPELSSIFKQAYYSKRKLIVSNLRLVVLIAKQYSKKPNPPLIDLIQEGSIGLNRAAEKFDPDKGFRFSTYASWWIRQAIQRSIQQHSRTIKLPVVVFSQVNELKTATRILTEQKGSSPTILELSKYLKMSVSRIKDLQIWSQPVCSTDIPIDPDKSFCGSSSINSLLSYDEVTDTFNEIDCQIAVDTLLQYLNPREQKIVIWINGLYGYQPHSACQVSSFLGISHERVRQIYKECLLKLNAASSLYNISSSILD